MSIVFCVCSFMLGVAALLTLYRLAKGPTMLDRSIALDVLLSVVVGALAIDAAWNDRLVVLPILLVIAALGFTGSVTVARFTRTRNGIEVDR